MASASAVPGVGNGQIVHQGWGITSDLKTFFQASCRFRIVSKLKLALCHFIEQADVVWPEGERLLVSHLGMCPQTQQGTDRSQHEVGERQIIAMKRRV